MADLKAGRGLGRFDRNTMDVNCISCMLLVHSSSSAMEVLVSLMIAPEWLCGARQTIESDVGTFWASTMFGANS